MLDGCFQLPSGCLVSEKHWIGQNLGRCFPKKGKHFDGLLDRLALNGQGQFPDQFSVQKKIVS